MRTRHPVSLIAAWFPFLGSCLLPLCTSTGYHCYFIFASEHPLIIPPQPHTVTHVCVVLPASCCLLTACLVSFVHVAQRMANRYDSVSRGRHPGLTDDDAEEVWSRHRAAQDEHERIRHMIDGLAEAHPGLADVLVRVSQLLDS